MFLEFGYLRERQELIVIVTSSRDGVRLAERCRLMFAELREAYDTLFQVSNHYFDAAKSVGLVLDATDSSFAFPRMLIDKFTECQTRLGQLLIPPSLGDLLAECSEDYLIVIPHRELHEIPWEIMPAGDQMLGLRFAMARTGSRTLLGALQRRRLHRRASDLNQRRALVSSDDRSLPGSRLEASQAVEILERAGYAVTWIHEDYSADRYAAELTLGPFEIVYYAGHGSFCARDPSLSALDFGIGDSLTARSISGVQQPGGGVVSLGCHGSSPIPSAQFSAMNACHTAHVGHINNEVIGLVRAWLESGRGFVVGGNWQLVDNIARRAGLSFLKGYIEDGNSAGKAMREVRREIQDPGSETQIDIDGQQLGGQLRWPLFWGAFSLHGDPCETAPGSLEQVDEGSIHAAEAALERGRRLWRH